VPSGTPTNVQVVAISSRSIRLTWEPPRPEDQNGIIVAYNITITEAETGRVWYFQKEGTKSLLVVNFLHPYYTYNCSISAETVGPGPPAFASITTHQEGKISMRIFVQHGGLGVRHFHSCYAFEDQHIYHLT